ncbi:MAG: 30S ribosomal protein S12 methylthiotransferase RimO [Planctomycetota bacterium]|jgi:ribosomal protein S12 methylthiotransferase
MGKKQVRIFFISLGCPKNLVDSEVMLGRLVQDNFVLCEDAADAEVAIINTCSFIEDARAESAAVIGEMLEAKNAGALKAVAVTGCWTEHEKHALVEKFPAVDLFAGFASYSKLGQHIRKMLEKKKRTSPVFLANKPLPPPTAETTRLRVTPPHYAYLRIAEGCSYGCSFCVIPKIRGAYRSKKTSDILVEAKELAADGARELVIIAQDTTAWGRDLNSRKGKEGLAGFLGRLAGVEGIEWIRVLYGHPASITDELLDVFASEHKIVKYLDIPLQHISDNILAAMNRKTTRAETEALVGKIRSRVPGIALRTSIITGFPGESEKEFEELCAFVEEAKFERCGVFGYSPEPGTRAANLPGQVAEEVIQERREKLLDIQEKIMLDYHKSLAGEIVPVIIDFPGEGNALGRTFADAPEIDPVIILEGEGFEPGTIGRARVTGTLESDMTGEFIGP